MSEATQISRRAGEQQPGQRIRYGEKRAARMERSRAVQAAYWQQRMDAARDPLERVSVAVDLLRNRLAKRLKKAAGVVRRAQTEAEKADARRRLAAANAEVERVCESAVEHLLRLADGVDTARR